MCNAIISGMNPRLSVLMPCYNADDTVEEALESLACQTLSDFELVVVDDGSTDGTSQILHKWAKRECRMRLITTEHKGIIQALNIGLDACSAPYIARMDSDDRCHSQRFEKQVNYLDEHSEMSVVSCQVAGFPADQVREGFQIYLDWLNSLVLDADIRREIFIESPLPHPSVLFRRQLIIGSGAYQEHGWAEDYDLWLRLYLEGAHFARLPEILLEWRERPDRLTRTDGRYSVENFLRAKAFYLARGPLCGRGAVIIWGAGMIGRRLAKQLERQNVPLAAFVDIDPGKIGHTKRGLPVIAPSDLPTLWNSCPNPVLLAAVGARGARRLIRRQLEGIGLQETQDWWCTA
jgi:glycosyltransferase involved in cell wall biosynthesis